MNSKRNIFSVVILVAIICLSILASANPVLAKNPNNTIDVYSGGSIQNAIDTALPGAKIIVHAGTYSQGPIIVDQTVTLLGKDAVIQYTKALTTDLDGAFNVRANDVRISGFTINSAYGAGVGGILSGIEVGWVGISTSGCQIDNNIINSPDWGVAGYTQTGVIVKNNVISARNPVFFTNVVDITIKNNYITAKTYPTSPINPVVAGIMLPGCYGALIKNNQINSENYGMLINQAPSHVPTNVEIKGNQILTSNDGIYSDIGNNFVVKNNDVIAVRYGIWLNDMQGTTATVVRNTVTSGSTAIYVGNAA